MGVGQIRITDSQNKLSTFRISYPQLSAFYPQFFRKRSLLGGYPGLPGIVPVGVHLHPILLRPDLQSLLDIVEKSIQG